MVQLTVVQFSVTVINNSSPIPPHRRLRFLRIQTRGSGQSGGRHDEQLSHVSSTSQMRVRSRRQTASGHVQELPSTFPAADGRFEEPAASQRPQDGRATEAEGQTENRQDEEEDGSAESPGNRLSMPSGLG